MKEDFKKDNCVFKQKPFANDSNAKLSQIHNLIPAFAKPVLNFLSMLM